MCLNENLKKILDRIKDNDLGYLSKNKLYKVAFILLTDDLNEGINIFLGKKRMTKRIIKENMIYYDIIFNLISEKIKMCLMNDNPDLIERLYISFSDSRLTPKNLVPECILYKCKRVLKRLSDISLNDENLKNYMTKHVHE